MTMTDAPPPGWVLTIEGAEYVAYRPIGWAGPDPHIRVSAPTRDALIHKLTGMESRVLDPNPIDDDAPLTPAEEDAHRRQGERLERETLEGTQ